MAANDGTDPADLRVSDAEREHVRTVLHTALERGMITLTEFDERSAQVSSARTQGELAPTVADLAVQGRAVGLDDGSHPSESVELSDWFNSIKRRGSWQVPRKLVLHRRLGSVELDFTSARIDHDRVDIELDVVGGSVEMRLPHGASASIDGVVATMGSVEDHRKNASPTGRPHFEITGHLRLGSVELRGPRRKMFG